MKKRKENPNVPSELRRDLVTGEWIVVARNRGKRPDQFQSNKILPTDALACSPDDPFINPQASGNASPVLEYVDKKKEWTLQVIPNKFPAFAQLGECMISRKVGPYEIIDGRGFHEVVITKDCVRHLALFSHDEVEEVIRAYSTRYRTLKKETCVKYISIFHNHGKEAGASIAHPHSQIIAIPVVPPDVSRSLEGAKKYYAKNGQCVHCKMIEWEMKDEHRVIYENDSMIAFCPFISRTAFEIRVFPKNHSAQFEKLSSEYFGDLGDALRISLAKLNSTLENPSYNFFIHTAPVGGNHSYYHWHIEILPKTAVWAGFELSTGIEISTIEPERAAGFLRNASI